MGFWTGYTHFFVWLLPLTFICTESQFIVEPSDKAVVTPEAVDLGCELGSLPLTESPRWYRFIGNPPVREELWNGRNNRFFIKGNRNAGEYNLRINSSRISDSGLYSCSYGDSSTPNASLTVLPTSWSPVCKKLPANEQTLVGDSIDLHCSSTGSSMTVLQWLRDGTTMIPSERSQNGTMVSITLYERVPNDQPVSFVCEASIPGLDSPGRCDLGPYPDSDSSIDAGTLIPFIVVGVLSLVVILLFLVVLYILFRHRQCRYCQREMPEPQMVLDADAIAAGHGFPTVIVDDEDDDDGTVNGALDNSLSNDQPDLLSSINTRTNLSEKSPNSTLRENMERGKRGTVPTKKHSEAEKLRPSEIRRLKQKRPPSGSLHVETSARGSNSNGRDIPDTPSPVSVDMNITPRTEVITPDNNQSDQSLPGVSSRDPSSSAINDLDASIGRKNRFTKRKDSKKSSTPVTPPISPRNITEPSTSAMRSDTVIYAELDFSKNVGMNILGDEQL